ncbi:unnamed protein product [Plutella xylostella]|uniref:(diamondback moth) hypothetical protein n=1 Tax=Plutella xylostella TaxID=51655 RepID=A0A8S4GBP0_PLUXY|nr:unnamed protein product [Plutella xylostella]
MLPAAIGHYICVYDCEWTCDFVCESLKIEADCSGVGGALHAELWTLNRHVPAMVEGRDRRPELGYKLAMELKTALEDH